MTNDSGGEEGAVNGSGKARRSVPDNPIVRRCVYGSSRPRRRGNGSGEAASVGNSLAAVRSVSFRPLILSFFPS